MGIIEAIIGILLIVWFFGFILSIGGLLIHILLIIAVVLIVIRFLQKRKQ